MRAFRRTSRGVEARLDEAERALLTGLVRDLLALLDDDVVSSADPVLQRFFPDAYGDDASAAEEFRSLTEADLRAGKREAATAVLTSLEGSSASLVLDDETGELWLLTLNDLRLALGTRLGVDEETFERLAAGTLAVDDSALMGYQVYELLSWLQESLVAALSG